MRKAYIRLYTSAFWILSECRLRDRRGGRGRVMSSLATILMQWPDRCYRYCRHMPQCTLLPNAIMPRESKLPPAKALPHIACTVGKLSETQWMGVDVIPTFRQRYQPRRWVNRKDILVHLCATYCSSIPCKAYRECNVLSRCL